MSRNQDLVDRIQECLKERDVPAWLFYGFHDLDPTAYRILRFPESVHATRRWFYLVPAEGEPRKLVHRIESGQLDHLPGSKDVYLPWPELREKLKALLHGAGRVAMQYSPNNEIPYLSKVDAGTVELIRGLGAEVFSSGDLVQLFEAVWTDGQLEQHRVTARQLTETVRETFELAQRRLRGGEPIGELEIRDAILARFQQLGLEADHPPIVGINEHSGNPHYAPSAATDRTLRQGDFLLIDLWAKPRTPEAVYADITWTAFFGAQPDQEIRKVFEVVRDARDRGVQFLNDRLGQGHRVEGWEVDDAVRGVIERAGYGPWFSHRTGHNLSREVHGNGVHFDNLESHDTRQVIPGIACTIEPGIYLDRFGVRSEVNVFVHPDSAEVTTPPQRELLVLPAEGA